MITGHGDDIYDYSGEIRHNFSSNVYQATQMPGLREFLCKQIDCIGHYPPAEPVALERMLSVRHRNRQGEIIITHGATEAIYLLAQTMGDAMGAERCCRSAILAPTFSEYADACMMHHHEVSFIRSLEELTDSFHTVWLCNPNNPTGTVIPKSSLVEAAFQHPQTVFVIDQSYAFFCQEELLQPREAAQLGNVVLLYSMTKKYAIPGLRLGYACGPLSLIDTLRQYRMPWSVNALAQQACWYILNHEDDFHFDIPSYLQEAQRLHTALNTIDGVEAFPTQTHFMLVRMSEGDSIMVKRHLVDEYGILVRSADNFVGLDRHYIRVAAQSAEENDLLTTALDQVLNHRNS